MLASPKKISIKLKKVGGERDLPPPTPCPKKIKVSYVFLAKGGFLYDRETQNLYSVESPHRFIGTLAEMATEEDE